MTRSTDQPANRAAEPTNAWRNVDKHARGTGGSNIFTLACGHTARRKASGGIPQKMNCRSCKFGQAPAPEPSFCHRCQTIHIYGNCSEGATPMTKPNETPAALPERRWYYGYTTNGESNHAVSTDLLFGKPNTRAECGREMRGVEPFEFDRTSAYACKRCNSIITELLAGDVARQSYADAARQDAGRKAE